MAFLRSPMIRLRCMVGAPNIAIATPPRREYSWVIGRGTGTSLDLADLLVASGGQ